MDFDVAKLLDGKYVAKSSLLVLGMDKAPACDDQLPEQLRSAPLYSHEMLSCMRLFAVN